MIELGVWLVMPVAFWRLADETSAVGMLEPWLWMNSLSRGIVILLAVMLVRALSVSGDCLVRFSRTRRQSRLFVRALNLGSRLHAEQILALGDCFPQSHIAKIFGSGLIGASQLLPWCSRDLAIEGGKRSMTRTIFKTHVQLQYGLATLATIVSTAPFIGLLGAVGGLLNAFGPIGMQADAARAWVAKSISDSLLTTALGLLVAVPAAWSYNFFREWLYVLRMEMENASSEFFGYLTTSHEWRAEYVYSMGREAALPSFSTSQNGTQHWEVPTDSHILFLLPVWLSWLYCLYALVRGLYFSMK